MGESIDRNEGVLKEKDNLVSQLVIDQLKLRRLNDSIQKINYVLKALSDAGEGHDISDRDWVGIYNTYATSLMGELDSKELDLIGQQLGFYAEDIHQGEKGISQAEWEDMVIGSLAKKYLQEWVLQQHRNQKLRGVGVSNEVVSEQDNINIAIQQTIQTEPSYFSKSLVALEESNPKSAQEIKQKLEQLYRQLYKQDHLFKVDENFYGRLNAGLADLQNSKNPKQELSRILNDIDNYLKSQESRSSGGKPGFLARLRGIFAG